MKELKKQLEEWDKVKDNDDDYHSWRIITKMEIEKAFGNGSSEFKAFNRMLCTSTDEDIIENRKSDKIILQHIINSKQNKQSDRLNIDISKINSRTDELLDKLVEKTLATENSFEIAKLINTIAKYYEIKSDNQFIEHTINMRNSFSKQIICVFSILSILSTSAVIFNSLCGLNIPENVQFALLAQIPLELIGILILIAKNLFPQRTSTRNTEDDE